MENINVKIEPVKDGKAAIVVFVHDDGDRDTCEYLLGEFEKNDLCGTIAMVSKRFMNVETGELDAEAVAYWQALLDTGRFHLSSHSRTHSFWGLTDEKECGLRIDNRGVELPYSFEAGRITWEVGGSRDDMRRAFPSQRMLTFVKPGFGRHASGVQVSEKAYEIIRKYYIGMRNTGGGVSPIPTPDVYNIRSYMVRAGETEQNWTPLIDKAISERGLIVFLFHGIVEEGAGISVSKRNASPFLAYLGEKKRAGEVWCTTLEEATLYTEEYRCAKASAARNGDSISISLSAPLDASIYDCPLTLRVSLPDGWTRVSLDGKPLEVQADENGRFIFLSVAPNAPEITVKKEA